MSNFDGEQHAVVDAFANLIADITEAPDDEVARRLRSVITSALRAQLRDHPTIEALPSVMQGARQVAPENTRAGLVRDLAETEAAGDVVKEVVAVIRRDERQTLFQGSLVDSLTGILPAERLGPFQTLGGIDIWFDIYLAARRMEVRETGASAPILVITEARPPLVPWTNTTIDIEPGTVWIRGDFIDASLPASAYVGIKVTGGSLKLNQRATITEHVVEIPAPLIGVLQLDLAEDNVTPVDGACLSADVKVTLPKSLTFTFNSGSATVSVSAGTAQAWGQVFDFSPPTGSWTFIQGLWTAVLTYNISPPQFDAGPIDDDLVHFQGIGEVSSGGLGLPVVVAPDPAILGETSRAAGWYLQVRGLDASWYSQDTRLFDLDSVWIAISAFGVDIVAENIAPLSPGLTHSYDLWGIAGRSDKRLPWRQTYKDPFPLFYRCHVIAGEYFLVQGRAEVALDRPVMTNGVPVPTPTAQGYILMHKFGGKIDVMLEAVVEDERSMRQFALRNALVWTSAPSFLLVRGELTLPQQIDAGKAQLIFPGYAWAPTLPDPYVSNAFLRSPDHAGSAQFLLYGFVAWDTPGSVTVSFEGQLGLQLALGGRQVSSGEPRPQYKSDGNPDVGLTQVEQDSFTFTRQAMAQWEEAKKKEEGERGGRVKNAQQENETNMRGIDNTMTEIAGPAPRILLLDVSTNQDLLGVAVGNFHETAPSSFLVSDLAVQTQVGGMRVVALPQTQWEPVRTLDSDQDIMTLGWFPTPLASATDGGSTQIGVRSQKLKPVIPEDALQGTFEAYKDGTPVGIRTTFPFGLISVILLQPKDMPPRLADLYDLTRPNFPDEQALGGIQVTAKAEGGRPDDGGISPTFQGRMAQLLNGVDLPSGLPLGISVLGSTADPSSNVEAIFNLDMAAHPRVPVTRIDLSGYGGSNFSDWNNPFAAFSEAAKVQFQLMIGRTALEVIKVNSVLHPWGVRVTRTVTIERRPGGGVIRRDSGWQAFTPGLFDYRYFDPNPMVNDIVVAPYVFDAGVFRGLFNVRSIRPAPGTPFSQGVATLIPYYFDADLALEGVPERVAVTGILGYLQVTPNGVPAGADALQALIQTQGPIGGPVDTWMNFGGSGLPFRVQRIEVGLAMDGVNPIFVATARGVPHLPANGAWSVVVRQAKNVPPNGGEAVTVAENRGVPLIRRYPIQYNAGDKTAYTKPPLVGVPGDYRFADAADLLTPAAPANDYALLQNTPTHSFFFPRPTVPTGSSGRIESGYKPALADIIARTTSKGAFPPAGNTIEQAAGSLHFDVSPGGKLALSAPITIVGYPNPLRLAGSDGHGSTLFYDMATIHLKIDADRWEAEFTGLRFWSDIAGLQRTTGNELRVVGSTEQRPQIAEIKTLLQDGIEQVMQYIPIFGNRGTQGPIDLGATNSKHETEYATGFSVTIPPTDPPGPAGFELKLRLFVRTKVGLDPSATELVARSTFGAGLDGKFPILSIGVASVFLIVSVDIKFILETQAGTITKETLRLLAFVGVGVEGKIGPFKAYAFLGVGFVLVYDAVDDKTKYGGLVALEAGVDLVIVKVKIRAELQGLVFVDSGKTKCRYSGSVEIHVEIFFIFSINESYEVAETTSF